MILLLEVVEGIDLADGLPDSLSQFKDSTQSFKLHSVFLRLSILDERDCILQTLTSHTQTYSGTGEIDFFKEEFYFAQALPIHSIQISSFFCHYVSPGQSADQCAGVMILPLNRLEENIPVRIELVFFIESVLH